MKLQSTIQSLLIPAAFAIFTSCAATHSDVSAPAQMDEAAMMEKWAAYATPNDAHKVLAAKAGRWSMKVRCFTAPGAPAVETNAISEMKWILDGRFLEDHTNGEMMGQPFQGLGHVGYDNIKGKYISTWTDNMCTGILKGEGTYDSATKTFTYASEMPDPMSGRYVTARSVERVIDNDHWVMQIHAPGPDGQEFMMMELVYTRAL